MRLLARTEFGLFAGCLFVLCFCNSTSARKLPSYIERCHRNDPKEKVNACFRKAVEVLKPHLRDGVPEMQLPSLNPLVIQEAALNSGSFKASFKNIEIFYADEFILQNLDVDLKANHVELELAFPRLRIKSNYILDGRILVLQLNGHGPADGNFTDVSGKIIADGHLYMKNGKQFISFEDSRLELKLGHPVFKFEDIFRDNRELTEQTNRAINENIDDLLEELRPVVDKTIYTVISGIINRVFARYSYDELFL